MKPRQRLLLNLRKYHYERIKPDSDAVHVEKVSKTLTVLTSKLYGIKSREFAGRIVHKDFESTQKLFL